ncbi:MAG TPA: DUF4199 domain-containing protein [Blastocatellia bacterium]|nr:DUF4199 domain-containing protein [Blastocatellia bacterium]
MQKVSLIFGLLAGILVSGFMILFIVLWENTGKVIDNQLVGYAAMIIALSLIFFGIKSYRDQQQSGAIRFWKGAQVGLLITLVASLMYATTWEAYNRLRPASSAAFIDYYIECQLNKQKEQGASSAQIEQEIKKMDEMRVMYRNPVIRFGITLMEILPVGIVITLISAAILRKKQVLPA